MNGKLVSKEVIPGMFITIFNFPNDGDKRIGYVVDVDRHTSKRLQDVKVIFDYRRKDENDIETITAYYIETPQYSVRFSTCEEVSVWKKQVRDRFKEWMTLQGYYVDALGYNP